jgi:arabinofuranan 3-O-arabinosyltransferase
MLDSLESLIDTGSGSPYLGAMLGRIGVGYVVVRHDLSTGLVEQPTTSLVGIALARSGGLRRVAIFGKEGLGPAIEIYKVATSQPASAYRITPEPDVATVASGPADVLAAVGLGVIDAARAAVVAGYPGWDRPAQVVGDGYQLRVRNFGFAHDAEGPVLSPDEPRHAIRLVENYPGSPGSRSVVAGYDGVSYVDASSSQAYPDTFGPLRAEDAPFSAVDGDPRTSWVSAALTRPVGQYLELHFPGSRSFGSLHIESPPGRGSVSAWSISAGGHTVRVATDPRTGGATADLGGVRGRTLRITVAGIRGHQRFQTVSIAEVQMAGLPARRTLLLPDVATAPRTDFVFHAPAETRPCVPTLFAPDCQPDRFRPSSEGYGIDRTFTVDNPGQWSLVGNVVARTSLQAEQLVTPLAGVVMHGSSTYFGDPGVSARMAYDDSATTSWIASPADRTPSLDITFPTPRTIDRISIARPSPPAVAPAEAEIVAGSQRRQVRLDEWGTFGPLRARHLRITFGNRAAGRAPIGIAELWLRPGSVAQPVDGTAPTGASCGFGPNVYVDGKRRLTEVRGRMGDVVSGGALSLTMCGKPFHLDAGTHRIRVVSTDQFQPVSVVVGQDDLLPPMEAARSLRVEADGATSDRVRVGPGAASILQMTSNANAGWRAELGGHQLEPIVVDGWAQGWRLPSGAGGTVHVTFAPQAGYLRWLVGGLVVAGLLMLAALVVGVRARRRFRFGRERAPAGVSVPASEPTVTGAAVASRVLARRVAAVAAVAGAWLVFGLPGALGVLLAFALAAAPALRIPVGAVTMLAGSVVTTVHLQAHPLTGTPDAANLIAGIGVVTLLTSGFLARPTRRVRG